MNFLKLTVLSAIFLLSFNSFALNTQSEELNELSGVECMISHKYGNWGSVSFANGAYIDNYGHYLWVNFASDEELQVRIYKRKSLISSFGGLINDEAVLKYTHSLDDLVTYSDREKLFEVDFDTEKSVDIDFSRPRKLFKKSKSFNNYQYSVSCYFSRGSLGNFTLLLDNKISSSSAYNNRSNNKYESLGVDEGWELYYKSKAYEENLLNKRKY